MTQPKNSTGTSLKETTKNKYRIRKTKKYKRDFKKLCASDQYNIRKLNVVINLLAKGSKLPSQYKNNRLKGEMINFEECHIAPDWLLIYERHEDVLILTLQRTGSHNDLF